MNDAILKRLKYHYILLGAFLSLGSPLGLYFFNLFFLDNANLSWKIYLYNTISTLVVFISFGYFTGSRIARARFYSIHDSLTGLYNRRYLDKRLPSLIKFTRAENSALSLIMIDLDHFKKVNDTYGHTVGDKTLKAVAKLLQNYAGPENIIIRVGGEEFVIICPSMPLAQAVNLANYLRGMVEALPSAETGFQGRQTISAGVVEIDHNSQKHYEFFLGQADKLMYKAKQAGRNRVYPAAEGIS